MKSIDDFANTQLPKRLYKYMPINDYFWDLLENHSLWFAHQNDLNDPFDCKFAISESFFNQLTSKSVGTLLNHLKERIPEFSSLTEDEFREMLQPELKSERWRAGFYKMIFGRMGWHLCCFTTSPINELMWAHYGGNSTGACLEFDFHSTKDFEEKIHPVTYSNELVTINSVEDILMALFRKRAAWSYENEWRSASNKGGKTEYDRDALTAIYFGANTSIETINQVRKTMIDSGFSRCDFKQMDFNLSGVKFSTIRETVEP